MSTLRVSVYGLLLLAVFLALPSSTRAQDRCFPGENGIVCFPPGSIVGSDVDSAPKICQSAVDSLWKQWRDGTLLKKGFIPPSIDYLTKLKQDCPKLAGSVDRVLKAVKAQQEKEAKAVKHVKKTVEAVQSGRPCRPATMGPDQC